MSYYEGDRIKQRILRKGWLAGFGSGGLNCSETMIRCLHIFSREVCCN